MLQKNWLVLLLKNRDKTKLFCFYFLFLELANAFYTVTYLGIYNGAELGGATGAMAPLVFWS